MASKPPNGVLSSKFWIVGIPIFFILAFATAQALILFGHLLDDWSESEDDLQTENSTISKANVNPYINAGKIQLDNLEIDMTKYEFIWNDGTNIIVRDNPYDEFKNGQFDCKKCPQGYASTGRAYHLIKSTKKLKLNADISGIIPYFSSTCPMIDNISEGIITIRVGNACGAASATDTKYYFRSFSLNQPLKNGQPEYLGTTVAYTRENFIMLTAIAFILLLFLLPGTIVYTLCSIIKKKSFSEIKNVLALLSIAIIFLLLILSLPYWLDGKLRYNIQEQPKEYNMDCYISCLG